MCQKKFHTVVSAEKFVRSYMETYHSGRSVKELAKTLKMKYGTVVIRVHTYRKMGIKLPKLARPNGLSINIAKLQKFVKI